MINSICVVIMRPQGEEKSALGLRMAWAAHAGGFETTLLFIDDGVCNLLARDCYNRVMIDKLTNEKARLCCLSSSLDSRNLDLMEIPSNVQKIDDEMAAEIITTADAVAVF